jgi:ribosomal protein L7Ae-like RNA K-turn-binding protein
LTIARKAGKIVFGFDPSVAAKPVLLLTATDISPKTLKELKFKCPDTPILEINLSKSDLSEYFHKSIAIVAVCDDGFATAIKKAITDEIATTHEKV